MPDTDAADGRLIVLSNRLPKGGIPAGGLVFALHEALSDAGGIWIGAADPGTDVKSGLTRIDDGTQPYERHTFDLTEREHEGFYLGYSNAVLWPLFHHRSDLLHIREGDFASYAAVNARVARAIAGIVEPDDVIWIHDYHFLMVAHELRALGVQNRIGLFLHIPFPSQNEIMALPQVALLPGWIAAHDLFGVQTTRDVAAVNEVLKVDKRCQVLADGTWIRDSRLFQVRSFPIGIDADGFAEAARTATIPRLTLQKHAPLLIGVDRLDYSKGLVHRIEAFGAYLERRDPGSLAPTFLQIAPTSRGDVAAYQEIREELERAAGHINGIYAELDWTPVRYVNRHIDRDVIAGLYRRADVALVTPLADGMNLVAKEFVAAQDPEDPGVLILSHFAGAVEQLSAALLVNPFDQSSFADAIERALTMDLEERKERHAALRKNVFDEDIAWWTQCFLDRLNGAPRSFEGDLKSLRDELPA
ncbi:alpha,alpha-trehalose-phosphate synthase (UDP-forming) [Jannaschia aquimarina]|uniref:OtsA protein n=1 Tax=Jannaschia aquimarina TaxID=935700 RepID=A0A0D1EPC5_9RHOB|nr:trehalose-6-phosphate synthase [Jannaschia aquimarina]KIT17520.1 Alpha,alpha-trehalose-phosphate synthase [Jannaschia aquimarina]SNS73866.1 trehalose 6-phosphate synthase [Jannaschia aquimarina]